MHTTILLTRHGQTEWNREERYRGQMDIPLNETGERQAAALAERLASFPVHAIYAGPLQRARRTAEICAERLRLPVHVLPGLLDLNFGAWQGLTPAQAAQRDPDLHQRWLQAPSSVAFPEGESLRAMQRRAFAALEETAARHLGQTIVLVAHMAVNKALLCAILGLDLDRYWMLHQGTCCLNIILRSPVHAPDLAAGQVPHRYEIVTLNDVCHIAAMG